VTIPRQSLDHRLRPASPAPAEVTPPAPPARAAAAAPDSCGLLTAGEVALRLGVTPRTLEGWRGTGEGPRFVRLGPKTIRYRAADVDAFVRGRVRASTAG
jgi:predicted DNA-binding transcriptional regulator AlpA